MKIDYDTPIAAAPFDDKNADLRLRSSDGVHFYVYKAILCVASEFFRDMFSLPQAAESQCEDGTRTTLDMSENKDTLDSLLRYCYPVRDPIIEDLSVCFEILKAALKYQIDVTAEIMSDTIKQFIPSQPLAVYGLACQPSISSEPLAREAAKEWLKQKSTWVTSYKFEGWLMGTRIITVEWEDTTIGESYDPDYMMGQTTAGQYYRLLRCIQLQQLPSTLLENEQADTPTINVCHSPSMSSTLLGVDDDDDAPSFSKYQSFDDFLDDYSRSHSAEGDVLIRSIDGRSFRTYNFVLQLASKRLLSSMEIINSTSGMETREHQPTAPTYYLPEPGVLIHKVLQICDPSAATIRADAGSATLLYELLRIGVDYDIPKVSSFVQLHWSVLVQDNPLRSYFTAVLQDWEELAGESAMAMVFYPVEHVYVREMENVPSISYYSLLKYLHDCQRVLITFLQKYGPKGTRLLRMIFTVPKDGEINESSVNKRWDCDSIVSLCYASKMFMEGKNPENEDFHSILKSSKSELKENLSEVELDWYYLE